MLGIRGIKRTLGAQLYACGKENLPICIKVNGEEYEFVREFKHDFFAATGLYKLRNGRAGQHNGSPDKVVLKLSRQQNLLGLPMGWFGGSICENEIINLKRLCDLQQIPKLVSRWSKCGLIYEYIEGKSLRQNPQLPDDFFDKLNDLLKKVHDRRIVYLDMDKRNNILLGDDSLPHIIDFQVSIRIPERFLISRRLSNWCHEFLTRGDIYHLYKHKRRLQPWLLTERQRKLSYYNSRFIKLHRFATTPIRRLRRAFLSYLSARGYLFRGRR